MALGIIIHISVGSEKRTEFFSEEFLRIGSDETCDLQIHTKQLDSTGVWLQLENTEGVFRITDFDAAIGLTVNGKPIRRFIAIADGDVIDIPETDISLGFFALEEKPSLIATKRADPYIAPFISEAALDAAATPQRDDAKAFLREFVRELSREISWTTKAIVLVLAIGFLSGILYLGYAVSSELAQARRQAEDQREMISRLENQLGQTSHQLGELDKTNRDLMKTVSLAPNLRVEYGNAICLIVGVYDLVDRSSGRVLRYQDPYAIQPSPYEPPSEGEVPMSANPFGVLTTEGSGSPVEYDFIGTGFHVGDGYIVTNRHVLQPWTEDDIVKTMMRNSNGRARIKRLEIYFPNLPQPFPLRVLQTSSREDLAVASIEKGQLPEDLPVIPLETDSEASTIGKTVVTMGYPSGPDRLLAMVDDEEANSINRRFGNSRQALIQFLAQSRKIAPLTTQGAITDLDTRRIVHDARTAEGGSGAPLFGQTGKVIGVNFGVFTENTAVNMAVPISYAIELLRKTGWLPPEERPGGPAGQNQVAATNANTSVTVMKPQ
ncbi:MAG TPA: trypsin-like peptidase domain-containing protein [Pyrinomonadaceae bacterium]|nr:trypsin-like peptidase domain-containing protein [Pyrinomonadaceae bacterium]HMP66738.1 trypsin-like peptidase domain-containing protein [Pyrinomonadaceae bacterium]